MSNITETGISSVKETACKVLLDYRLVQKTKDPKRAENVLNRIHVSMPKGDSTVRPPIIPQSVQNKVQRPEGLKTAKEL